MDGAYLKFMASGGQHRPPVAGEDRNLGKDPDQRCRERPARPGPPWPVRIATRVALSVLLVELPASTGPPWPVRIATFPELGEPSREAKAQHRPPVAGEDRNSPDMVPPVMLSLSQHRPPVAGEDRNRGRLRSKLTRTMCQHCGPPTSTQAPDPGYEEPGHAGAGTAVRRKAARSRADR